MSQSSDPPQNLTGPHIEVEVVQVKGHLKEGRVVSQGREFIVFSDEGVRLGGGNNSAPAPLAYFTLGIGF